MADGDDSKGPKPPDPDDPKAGPDDAVPAQPPAESEPLPDRFAGLYETHIGRLIAIARDDFGVAEPSAVDLAHEVMMTFIHAADRVRDVPPWLDGAISYAAEAYALQKVFVPTSTDDAADLPDVTLPNGVPWRAVAEQLTPRFRRVLEMRYVEGRSVAEIAEILGTTQRYVETLLERCLRQAAKLAARRDGQ